MATEEQTPKTEPTLAEREGSLEERLVTTRDNWVDGPPHAFFKELRSDARSTGPRASPSTRRRPASGRSPRPTHVREVSRDWETYSSEIGGVTGLTDAVFPLELQQGMFIGMDPPKHDRLKALFQRGFTPEADRRARGRDPGDHRRRVRQLGGRERCDLVTEVAQPVVARVIGSFMGIAARGRRRPGRG